MSKYLTWTYSIMSAQLLAVMGVSMFSIILTGADVPKLHRESFLSCEFCVEDVD